jgi:hypothetical protein
MYVCSKQTFFWSSDELAVCWYKEGKLHRGNNLPAMISCKFQTWYKFGQRHRDNDLPAVIYKNGDKEWWVEGLRHRNYDRPAIITKLSKTWFSNGACHRNFGLPAHIEDGSLRWIEESMTHRIKKPALIYKQTKNWMFENAHHRGGNLPAITHGKKKEFYHFGEKFYFKKIHKKNRVETKKIIEDKTSMLCSVDDLPSVVYKNGTKEWHVDDMLHRDNDLPAVEYSNGDKEWWYFGRRHRMNGPAVIYGNKKHWYGNGVFIKCTQ